MPTFPQDLQRRTDRFREQRWLLDAVIKTVGVEWDQNRLHYLSGPLSPDYKGPVLGLEKTVKRWDDIAPEFTAVARRFEIQAIAADKAGHNTTASDGFFAAAIMYGGAQWPILANTELNQALEQKKNACFARYIEGADHRIEPIEIPYRGKSLPAYLHLPPGYTGGRLPCAVMIEGMDTFKEMAIFGAGDRFLRRGMACLVVDGPGQGSSLLREIWYDPDTYGEVGTAAVDFLLTREEIDGTKIMAWGLSFGSFWATQIAAAEPRFAACAVMYTSFQPGNWPYFEMASPAFTPRFMYMTGTDSDDAFAEVTGRIDVMRLSPKLEMPYFVLAGEDDTLSDFGHTIEHMNNVPGPKTLVAYAGEEHGIFGARSSQLGPPFFPLIADWMADRAAGKPLESTYNVVDRNGQLHSEPWGERRTYQYGAPLGVEQLFAEEPPIGLS
jgi:pimeloyl-ACP methyl ester carboxylesterase